MESILQNSKLTKQMGAHNNNNIKEYSMNVVEDTLKEIYLNVFNLI